MKRLISILFISILSILFISCGDDKPTDPGGGDEPENIVYKKFGGDEWDWGRSVTQTSDKSYVICGSTDSFGSGPNTGYLLKIDAEGSLVWGNLFGGNGDDNGENIIELASGELIIGGVSSSFSGSHDFYLLKTDALGDKIWENNYGQNNRLEWATSLKETSGGYALGGYTSDGIDLGQFYLVKTDANGNKQWDFDYGSADIEWSHGMDITHDNGYIMAGIFRVKGSSVNSPFFIKVDANGNKQWEKKIIEPNSDTHIKCVTTVSDGGYVAAGYNWAFSGNNKETYVVKINSDSTIAWKNIYNTVSPNVIAEEIIECPDGTLLITGAPINTLNTTSQVVVMKLAADGTFMWSKIFEPLANAEGMVLDDDGNLVITGFDYTDTSLPAPDVLFLRIPADSL